MPFHFFTLESGTGRIIAAPFCKRVVVATPAVAVLLKNDALCSNLIFQFSLLVRSQFTFAILLFSKLVQVRKEMNVFKAEIKKGPVRYRLSNQANDSLELMFTHFSRTISSEESC